MKFSEIFEFAMEDLGPKKLGQEKKSKIISRDADDLQGTGLKILLALLSAKPYKTKQYSC